MILTILIFIVILGLLVFVHEFGHFFVAKKSGMKVDEFGFGFPPRLAGIQKINGKFRIVWGHKPPLDTEKTVYSINWIPLGGFVKIVGENNEQADNPQSFINKPFLPRFLTLVAGVVMNWILAAVIFSLVLMIGVTSEITPELQATKGVKITKPQVAISQVAKDSPAEKSGLLREDIILSVDGKQFEKVADMQAYIRENKGKVFEFKVQRINEIKDLSVASKANPAEGEGPTGIGITDIGKAQLPFFQAINSGVAQTFLVTKLTYQGLASLFTSKEALEGVGGPFKIGQIVGQVRHLGVVPLLNLTGLLSINLAIINLLPIPALDGGRVSFLIIEKFRRRRNNQKLEQLVNTVGFLFLILLMIIVTIKDLKGFIIGLIERI